jgi:hypothetical protein
MNIQKIEDYYATVSGRVVLGIDGYIDEVWQLVETRKSVSECSVYSHMNSLGELVMNREGSGMAVEILRKRRGYGGFTGNTGNALLALDVKTVMLGMYGKSSIDPIFKDFQDVCEIVSLDDPAICHIFEFTDGKIMFPYIDAILRMNWDSLVDTLGMDRLTEIFSEADIVALGYWSNMPAFDDIIRKMCQTLFYEKKPKKIFFDFADLKKRTTNALVQTLDTLSQLNQIVPMTLSLNDNEAELLFSCYGEPFGADAETTEKTLDSVRHRIGIDEIIVHTPYYADIASAR